MTTKENVFFSGDNLDILYNVLKQDIQNRYNYNLDTEERTFKTEIFNNMSTVYHNHKEKNLKKINQIVLKYVAPKFIKQIQPRSISHKSQNKIRDAEIIDRQHDLIKQTEINLRPKTSNNNHEESIENALDIIKNERDDMRKPLLTQDDFQLPMDVKVSSDEMEVKFKNALKKRDDIVTNEININHNSIPIVNNESIPIVNNGSIPIVNNGSTPIVNNGSTPIVNNGSTPIVNNGPTPIVNNGSTPIVNNGSTPFFDNPSFVEIRNNEQIDIIKQNENSNPSDLYKNNMDNNTIIDKLYKEQLKISSDPTEVLIPEKKIKYHKTTNLVSISSIDRNWNISSNNRYNYSIFFSPSVDNWDKIPIYENNKTIPQNAEQYKNGVVGNLNINGWNDSNGKNYPKYNPDKPNGDIVGYDTILIKGNDGIKIDTIYKNIYSIELVNAFLPIENIIVSHDSNITVNIHSFPYLILCISEITDIYSSTNDFISNCFCKLVIDNNIKTNDIHRGFETLVPASDEKRVFFPKPLDSLNKLSIKILTPQGEILSNERDFYNFSKLSIEDPQGIGVDFTNKNLYIKIVTDNYFNEKILQKTDIIMFKKIQITHHDFSTNLDLREIRDQFINYLLGPDGHLIINLGIQNIYNCTNELYISNNGKINYDNGLFELNNYNYDSNKLIDFFNLLPNCDISGTFININLQNNFTFKIVTNEIDYKYTI